MSWRVWVAFACFGAITLGMSLAGIVQDERFQGVGGLVLLILTLTIAVVSTYEALMTYRREQGERAQARAQAARDARFAALPAPDENTKIDVAVPLPTRRERTHGEHR